MYKWFASPLVLFSTTVIAHQPQNKTKKRKRKKEFISDHLIISIRGIFPVYKSKLKFLPKWVDLLNKNLYQLLLPIDAGYDLQAIVVFVISIHAYAYEKSEMEEVSMVALSGCIWLQAFVVTLETK